MTFKDAVQTSEALVRAWPPAANARSMYLGLTERWISEADALAARATSAERTVLGARAAWHRSIAAKLRSEGVKSADIDGIMRRGAGSAGQTFDPLAPRNVTKVLGAAGTVALKTAGAAATGAKDFLEKILETLRELGPVVLVVALLFLAREVNR